MRTVLKRCIAAAAVALLAGAAPCFAGAWTLPQGGLYDKISLNYYSANPSFSDTNAGNYLEYGLTDDLSIVNSVYFKRIKNGYYTASTGLATTNITTGIADIELGLKHRLAEGAFGVLAHQGMLKIPGAYDKKGPLPLGNGQFDAEYRLLYGVSLWRLFPGYANIEAGYRWRAEAPSDEFRYLLEVGADITPRLYARVKLDAITSVNNADKMADQSGNPTTIYQYDLQKLDAALGLRLNGTWGVELGYTPTLYARNTADGTNYSVGITCLLR